MSSETKAHVGAIGFEIFVETFLDLTGATVCELRCEAPSGATKTFTATPHSISGPRGRTRYGARYITINAADLDEAGDWNVQAYAELPSGWKGPGREDVLPVGRAIT